ncbi:MAG: phenylalanine--tRNA ligase subunit beta [Phycisphaerales bacterium JB037]
MDISLNWLNRYLSPGDASAAEVEDTLTHAGFPIEETRELPNADTFLDVEITSNRGDCLSHLGLAREVAASSRARTERSLVPPKFAEPKRSGSVADALTLINQEPAVCPRFTAQVIRGVRVGPSPAWLVELLEAVGQRSINNVVDVTNWLTFELGQPAHVFDLAKLAGPSLIIRYATEGEPLTTLDGKARKLKADELVVADAQRAQSLAGVIGGEDSEVTEATTDIVLEAACWDPATIRRAARRHAIRTDAGYRFERGVDPRTIEFAARRAAAMIVELAQGTLCEGILDEGRPLEAESIVSLRPSRCRSLLGIDIPVGQMIERLRKLDISVEQVSEDELRCTIPPFRIDLTREVDLIEEVARTHGIDALPIHDKMAIRVRHPQESERALRAAADLLASLGFYETVTFSFIRPDQADAFLADDLRPVSVDDERRGAEPTLRPSALPSLLACRKVNQDARVELPGGVRLFERSAVFAEDANSKTVEGRTITMLMDAPGSGQKRTDDDLQLGIRQLRGSLEALVRALAGADATLSVEPAQPGSPGVSRAWSPRACGRVRVRRGETTTDLGVLGLVSDDLLKAFDLDLPVVAAELDDSALLGLFPPAASVTALPAFPDIERDLSLIVPDPTPWADIADLITSADLDLLEGLAFVGCYRGKQVGSGRKSVTLRLRFRAPDRTLRREEVEPGVESLVGLLRSKLGAEIRT